MPYNYTVPRCPIAAMYHSPGPCYNLPGLFGHLGQPHDPRSVHVKNPAYSFGLRATTGDKESSPGPKYYPNSKIYRDGMDGTPHYSMVSRRDPLVPFNTPGPASYSPEKGFPSSTHPTAPVYSIHSRNKFIPKFKTPAPNSYHLPPMVGSDTVESTKPSKPRYTLTPRSKHGGFDEDLAKAPGPGTYNETSPSTYKKRLPRYSMSPRVFLPGDRTQKPGPGAHRPEDCKMSKPEAPSYTFGLQHSPYCATAFEDPKD